jgi:transcriptional regulator with XRE-family HTH domain
MGKDPFLKLKIKKMKIGIKRLGETIKKRRVEKGLTMKEVAHAVGVDKSYIGLIENGLRTPVPEKLKKLSTFLGLPKDISGIRMENNFYEKKLMEKIKKIKIAVNKRAEKLLKQPRYHDSQAAYTYPHINVNSKNNLKLITPPKKQDAKIKENFNSYLVKAEMCKTQKERWRDIIRYFRKQIKAKTISKKTIEVIEYLERNYILINNN